MAASLASDYSTSHFLVAEMFPVGLLIGLRQLIVIKARCRQQQPFSNRCLVALPSTIQLLSPRRSIPDQMQHASSLR
jgi:hypothetical protein